jgi:hypothetical protein
MNFLQAVNRVLREEAILKGDDDDLTSFTQTQHAATSTLAQIAIQSELATLVSEGYIPFEEKTAVVTMITATRTYSLASDFQTFIELFMEKVDSAGDAVGTRIHLYPGNESQLRKEFYLYRENQGTPIYFYTPGGTTKTVGFTPVPNSDANDDRYRYYYEADVNVSVTTDTVPFTSTTEAQVFVRMAARHFKYLRSTPQVREGLFPNGIDSDPVIIQARATLMGLLNPISAARHYGKRYVRH